ncbi:MAG: amidohydrolase family protein [Tenuifilaceae bacterium]|jgi:cytosine/adenosine deaminase-related metal-dependent hydrolase|nr:amidohydrolase family protein [Tenuifilaceae bacterium]
MRRFSANYIYTNCGKPIRNGVVGVNDNGVVVEIIDHKGQEKEYAHTEFRNGIIVPGFVNAHCHTELSHLKGKIDQGTGLANFVDQIRNSRLAGDIIDDKPIQDAIADMNRQGIVAVADICNTTDSFLAKQNSKIRFVNLIEVLGLDKSKAEIILERAKIAKQIAEETFNAPAFLTPHSFYSLSTSLLKLLMEETKHNPIVSIHFAESREEELFTSMQKGKLALNYQNWNLPIDDAPSGNLINLAKRHLSKETKTLFVHNTFIRSEDAKELKRFFPNAYLVLCPASNLYIEKTLPNIPMLIDENLRIALGTDSLASTSTLSILEQIRIIQENFPQIPFPELLKWATVNGAEALGFEKELGTIELGKSPGLNLITPFDFANCKLKENSRVVKLV